VRSPGVYFTKEPDKTSDRDLFLLGQGHPQPGRVGSSSMWTSGTPSASASTASAARRWTVLLKAIGWSNEQIREKFGWSELMMTTLEKDHIAGADEALLDIYRKLRPGEPPTRENAQTLLDNLFLQRQALRTSARVGRYKFNKKLEGRRPDHHRHA